MQITYFEVIDIFERNDHKHVPTRLFLDSTAAT